MMNRYFISLLFFFLFLWQANAMSDFIFRTVSPEGGLGHDGITAILQDADGFVWILMDNEIYRFDGYTYKRYSTSFLKIDSTSEWNFIKITIDNNGILYVSTNKGLFRFDNVEKRFNIVSSYIYDALVVDERNNLWVRFNRRWGILDLKTKTILYPAYENGETPFLRNISCINDDNFYLFSHYGDVYRYNYARNEFSLCMTTPAKGNNRLLGAQIYKGKLWMLIEHCGLLKIDLSTFQAERNFEVFADYPNLLCYTFTIDHKGNAWIGTINGLLLFDPKTEKLSHFQSGNVPFSIPNNSIWVINSDNLNNLWIGGFCGSICYLNLDEKRAFESFFPAENGLSHVPVSSFAEDKDFIWIGTEGGGLNRFDKRTHSFRHYKDNDENPFLSFNNIKSLVMDKESNLWIGMFKGGIDRFNTKTGEVKHFKSDMGQNSIRQNDIRKIVLEGDSLLWITYQQQKMLISCLSVTSGSFTHFDFSGEYEDDYIFDVIKGRGNQLWLLTRSRLYMFDTKQHTLECIPYDGNTFLNFQSFCLDASGNLWIGTTENGIVKYDPSNISFTIFKDQLPQTVLSIFNICCDINNNLWLGANNGLILYDIDKGAYLKFDQEDGAQGQYYYPLAALKGMGEKLYFGGTRGFTIVTPNKLSVNNHKPKVIISDFFVNLHSSNSLYNKEKKQIILSYYQKEFGFNFSSDNYLMPEKNIFKYRLRGYDSQWTETDADDRTARYSKVPSGDYYFEIMTANNDGVWSGEPLVLKIIRKPAPWLSWPAYLFYCLIFLSVLFLLFRHFNNRRDLKLQLYREKLEEEKKEELRNKQLQFFTNISHDFRTPLSLIIAAIDKLRQEGLKEYYYQILNNNAKRLLNLVNDLMDFRTIEHGKMNLELQRVNVNEIISVFGNDFVDFASSRKIEFRMKLDDRIPDDVYLDKSVCEKIFMNLLNNAFKFSHSGGAVALETHAVPYISGYKNSSLVKGEKETDNMFCVVVKDTGAGIEEKALPYVFERFYKTTSVYWGEQMSTGIGLALVKNLVLLHRGMISIHSETGKGTDVVIYFSLDKKVYDENQFLAEHEPENKIPAVNLPEIHEEEDEVALFEKKSKKRILLAEDNDDLRHIIADYMSDEYDIIQAEDGLIASKILNETLVDLIISDIMMPRKDGITLSREVKENIETSHIPFVLLTAKTSLESKIEGADSGADMYFEKPVDLQLLKLSVQNILKHQQQLKEHYARNYFADSSELSSNEQDAKFIKDLIKNIEATLENQDVDVNYLAYQMSMSRSKLYRKIKSMTDKSIVEFVLGYKMKKAAKIIIESNCSIREIMDKIGIESQPYFTNAFKKEFGMTPTAFANKHKQADK
jgi:signal transduction histidine kinase/ligand-binding sensor domain-containing protein/DNA-binding response OmpR family regulator